MRYAIISDVHANDEALSCVLADASRQGARQIVCLGDIVGYGPMPSETLAHIRDASAITVAGNHDDAVSGRIDASNFTGLAADAAFRHREYIRHSCDMKSVPDFLHNANRPHLPSNPRTYGMSGLSPKPSSLIH